MTGFDAVLNEVVAEQVTESAMIVMDAMRIEIDEKLAAFDKAGSAKELIIKDMTGKELAKIDTPHPLLGRVLKVMNLPDRNYRNTYNWGPAGAGKSVLGYQVAKALNVEPYVLSTLTAKYEVGGFNDAMSKYVESVVYKWLKNSAGGTLIIEELDRGHAAAVIMLNELLASGKYTFANGEVLERSDKHYVAANGNTNMQGKSRQYAAAQVIDGSTRDRFGFMFTDYDEAFEITITPNLNWTLRVQHLRACAEKLKLDILCTTRAALAGWGMLKQEESQATVEEMYILRGCSPDVTQKLYREAGKPSTLTNGKVINFNRSSGKGEAS